MIRQLWQKRLQVDGTDVNLNLQINGQDQVPLTRDPALNPKDPQKTTGQDIRFLKMPVGDFSVRRTALRLGLRRVLFLYRNCLTFLNATHARMWE